MYSSDSSGDANDPNMLFKDDEVDFLVEEYKLVFQSQVKEPTTHQECLRAAALFHAAFFQLRDKFNQMMSSKLGNVPIMVLERRPKWRRH